MSAATVLETAAHESDCRASAEPRQSVGVSVSSASEVELTASALALACSENAETRRMVRRRLPPALLPSVATVTSPRISLEVVAIAAGIFALVQCLLAFAMPSELIWFAILVLAATRGTLRSCGHDLAFVRARRLSAASRRP